MKFSYTSVGGGFRGAPRRGWLWSPWRARPALLLPSAPEVHFHIRLRGCIFLYVCLYISYTSGGIFSCTSLVVYFHIRLQTYIFIYVCRRRFLRRPAKGVIVVAIASEASFASSICSGDEPQHTLTHSIHTLSHTLSTLSHTLSTNSHTLHRRG